MAKVTGYLPDRGSVRVFNDPYDAVWIGVLKDGVVRKTFETVSSAVERIVEGARELAREDEGRVM